MDDLPDRQSGQRDRLEQSRGAPVGRRVILSMAALGGLGIAFGDPIQRAIDAAISPLRRADPTGLTSLVPGASGWRYYSVTAKQPNISVSDYRLRVDGLVDQPLTLTYQDLQDLPVTQWTRDFQCVTGWRVEDVQWQGVHLRDVLAVAGVQSRAGALTFLSHDGTYTESLTLEQAMADEVMVATHLDGETVSQAHGGPARLVVVPMYGYKSLKWLSGIKLVEAVEPGYWEVRGYDVDAYVGESNGRTDEPV